MLVSGSTIEQSFQQAGAAARQRLQEGRPNTVEPVPPSLQQQPSPAQEVRSFIEQSTSSGTFDRSGQFSSQEPAGTRLNLQA